MAGTQFGSDTARAGPGRKVGVGPGQMERRGDRQQRRQGAQRQQAQPQAAEPHAAQAQLGHPWQQPPDEGGQQPDLRHVPLLSQYVNMRQLGRDQPFGLQASINGTYRQVLKPGQVPFDIFEDL